MNANNDDGEGQPEPEPIRRPEDALLSLWVGIANAGKGSIDVTLNVSGAIVTGIIAGFADYLDGVAAEFETSVGNVESRNELGGVYHRLAEEERARVAAEEDADETDAPTFIHLENAKMYAGGALIPSNRGVWWRGRLDSVDGWSFGSLSSP